MDLSVSGSNLVTFRILNGLTLDGGLIKLGSGGTVNFVGTQTLGGTGTVVFTDANLANAVLVPTASTTLTIGPGVTVHGVTGKIDATNAAFVNQGVVAADGGGTISLTGAANVAGGVLTGGHWQAIGASTLRFMSALITANAADIVLDGSSARVLADGSSAPTRLSVVANAAAGALTLRRGARLEVATNFDNAGTVTVGADSALVQGMGQFANAVLGFSSQFTATSWSAAQTLGPPNTLSYGDIPTAWTPLVRNGTLEFVTVGFATPVFATGTTVRETWGNGFVVRVDAVDTADVLHTVWTGVDPSQPGTPVEFTPTWAPTPYLVKGIKITVDTNHNLGTFEEIDSIELHGFTTTGSYRQTGGTTTLDGGRLTSSGAVDLQAGALLGTGTIEADVVNAARVDPGAPTGALVITRTYTQTPGGTLSIDLGGTSAGTQYDRLTVQGTASLGGTLDINLVNGFGPAAGQTFQVLDYASATGAFDTINGLKVGFKPLFTLDQGATGLVLTSVANASDLAFGDVTLPATGGPGQSLMVTYTVSNLQDTAATGDWFDSVYLSSSPVMDSTALLLGRVHHVGDVAGHGSYTGTLTAPVPNLRAGNYHAFVLVDSRGSIPDLNRANNTGVSSGVVTVSVPLLTIGTPVTDTIAAGQDVYYRLVVPPGQDITVAAIFGVATEAELYIRYGELPDRSTFDQTAADLAELQPKLAVVNAQGGDYYILLHGREGAGPGKTFTVQADSAGFEITRLTPDSGSTQGDTTVSLTGTRFTAETTVALTDLQGQISATADVRFTDSQRLNATFHLERDQVPEGFFSIRATDHGQTVTAAQLFEVRSGSGANVSLSIMAPAVVRVGQPIPITIKVINAGGSDGIAPIIEVRATNVAENEKTQQFFGTEGEGDQLPGTVLPDSDTDFSIVYQPTPKAAGTRSNFDLIVANPSTTLMDWDSQKEAYRPSYVNPAAWDAVWANFRPRVGNTLADFYRLLQSDADALARVGDATTDIHDLLRLELEKAANDVPAMPGSASVDLALPGPGMPLLFMRTAGTSLFDRFALGRLGRGWTDNFDVSIRTNTQGLVAIQAGNAVRFFGKLADGSYAGFPGELATLTAVSAGWQLRETDGSLTAFRQDGALDYLQDANGNRITATYTGTRLTRVAHSSGSDLSFVYNSAGLVSQVTESAGRVASYSYDAAGHLVSVTTPEGTTTYSYTSPTTGPQAHALASITNTAGDHVFFQYDTQGRLARQELDGGAQAVTYIYGINGYSATDALGRTATVLVDHLGRPRAEFDSLGHFNLYGYDEAGNLTASGASSGGFGTLAYDARGNPIAHVNPLGERQAFTYDAGSGQLASWTDAIGNTTAYSRDEAANLSQITYADGSSERFSRDARGNVVQSVSRGGQMISYTYDPQGLLLQKAFADGTHADYTYDARANMIAATDASGPTRLEYDGADRLTKITYPSGRFLRYSYDEAGRRTQLADQSGFTEHYAYDAVGRLARVTDAAGALVVDYGYDAAGQLIQEDRGNGTRATYEYDAAAQLVRVVHLSPDRSIQSRFDYTYDVLGHQTSVTTLDGTTSYAYDGAGRLTDVTLPDHRTITYQYDAAGNRSTVTDGGVTTAYVVDVLGQYTSIGAAGYAYDHDGNLVAGPGATYSYDVEGRLTDVVGPSGSWRYQYDAFGNRSAITHNGQTTEFVIDPTGLGSVVGEYASTGGAIAHYAQGMGLVSRIDATGQPAYYAFDAIGNTVQLTGASGSVVNRYQYLPYGESLVTDESLPNPFWYGGRSGVMRDGSGLDFMRARDYDPELGRFIQPDPIGLGGGVNLYAYVDNNPVSFSDPSGLIISALAVSQALDVAFAVTTPSGPFGYAATKIDWSPVHPGGNGVGAFEPRSWEPPAPTPTMPGPPAAPPGPPAIYTNPYSLPIGSQGGFTQAQADAALEQAFARIALRNAIRPGLQSLIIVGTAAFYWSMGSLYFAHEYRAATGHLPQCPDAFPDALNFITACDNAPITGGDSVATASVLQVGPHDPNELFGPGGFGPEQFIQPGASFPYVVYFENDPHATAPAQNVVVTEQLDADLDWSTFHLGDVGFGDVIVDVPGDRQFYSTRLDQRAAMGLFVDVMGAFDPVTGVVTWTFTSLDPATLDLPADPLAGFLPPDTDGRIGQGFTTYFVRPKAGTPSGTAISAQASVVFDTEAAIATPLWSNTIDDGGPSSVVTALLATTTAPDFTVRWSGADDVSGSGIGSFDVFVSDDGAPFAPLLTGTTLTSSTFAGQIGHTYAFFSAATDNVGHREANPEVPDATTRVVADQENRRRCWRRSATGRSMKVATSRL